MGEVYQDFREAWRYGKHFALHRFFYVAFLEFERIMNCCRYAKGGLGFAKTDDDFGAVLN